MRRFLDQAVNVYGPTVGIPGLEQLMTAGEEGNLQGFLNEGLVGEEKSDLPFSPMMCTLVGNGSTLTPRRSGYEARMA
jgi:hypothetical protein